MSRETGSLEFLKGRRCKERVGGVLTRIRQVESQTAAGLVSSAIET